MNLVGVWQLEDFVIRSGSRETRPYGPRPKGRLHASENGELLVSVLAEDQCRFASDDMQSSSLEEAATAFRNCVSYFGRFSFDAEQSVLRTEVQGALFPNWAGTVQQRFVEFHGPDGLTLTTPPVPWQGEEQSAVLRWSRVRKS